MPRDEAYSREKLERLFPRLHAAVTKGVRQGLDEYKGTAHIHRSMTNSNIVRDRIVDNLRADLMLDEKVSIKDQNQTTYFGLFSEFRMMAKQADDAGNVHFNSNQASLAFQRQTEHELFASEDLPPEATNIFLSYVPNSLSPRDPFVYVICPGPSGGNHWMIEVTPPAVAVAGEIGGGRRPDGDVDDLVRIPAKPKTDEEPET